MNITKSKFMSRTSTMVGAALLLSSVSSMATVGQKQGYLYSDWSGNYVKVGNKHANNTAFTRSYSRTDFNANEGTSKQTAESVFNVTSGIFKKKVKLLESSSSATAYRSPGSWSSSSIARTKLHGQSVYSDADYKTKGGTRAVATSIYERQFYDANATYTIGPFKVKYTALVKGVVNARAEARQKIHKNKGAFIEDFGTAKANGSVSLVAQISGKAELPYLAKALLVADFQLANVSNNTISETKRRHYYDNPRSTKRRYSGRTYSKYNVTLGGGKLVGKVKALTYFTIFKKTIASWPGIKLAQKVFINSSYDDYSSS